MLVFDHLNRSLPAVFDDLFKPFNKNSKVTIPGKQGDMLSIPKMKTSFYGFRSIQVKSVTKDWNNIIVTKYTPPLLKIS